MWQEMQYGNVIILCEDNLELIPFGQALLVTCGDSSHQGEPNVFLKLTEKEQIHIIIYRIFTFYSQP